MKFLSLLRTDFELVLRFRYLKCKNFEVTAEGEFFCEKKRKNERYFLNVNLRATENYLLIKIGQEQV